MTQDHKPHITLPNGDRIYQGGCGRTRDGRKVGPMVFGGLIHTSPDGITFRWSDDPNENSVWADNGCYFGNSERARSHDIIEEWTDEPEAAPIDNASPLRRHAEAERPTPDYNDGNWHGWNGEECPVHLQSVVEVMFAGGGGWTDTADQVQFNWTKFHGAFRVVKPYTAPREWWIVGGCEAYASEAEALLAASTLFGDPTPVHVREVTE